MTKTVKKLKSRKTGNESSKLKIAILHLGFFYSGGGERLVLEQANNLRKSGHSVECFAPVVDYKKCFPELLKKTKVKTFFPQLPSWFPEREAIQILSASALIPLLALKFRKFDVVLGANQPSKLYL